MKIKHFITTIFSRYAPVRAPHRKRKLMPRDGRILIRQQAKIFGYIKVKKRGEDEPYLKQILFEIESRQKRYHKMERVQRVLKALENKQTYPKAFYRFAKESASLRTK